MYQNIYLPEMNSCAAFFVVITRSEYMTRGGGLGLGLVTVSVGTLRGTDSIVLEIYRGLWRSLTE